MDLPIVTRVTNFNTASAAEFHDSITKAIASGQPVIPIVIDSRGGDVYSLMAMLDVVERAKEVAVVATVAEGRAFSCGSVLLSAGTPGYRFVGPNATVLVHEAAVGDEGKLSDMAVSMAEFKRLNEKLLAILGKNSGKGIRHFRAQLKKRVNTDWYMTPTECVRHGLADHVRTPLYVVNVDVQFQFG